MSELISRQAPLQITSPGPQVTHALPSQDRIAVHVLPPSPVPQSFASNPSQFQHPHSAAQSTKKPSRTCRRIEVTSPFAAGDQHCHFDCPAARRAGRVTDAFGASQPMRRVVDACDRSCVGHECSSHASMLHSHFGLGRRRLSDADDALAQSRGYRKSRSVFTTLPRETARF